MAQNLNGMRVAIVLEDAFEQVELTQPRKALDEAGAKTVLVSPQSEVQGWNHHTPADKFKVDLALEQANVKDFDAVMLPGGALNADKLRTVSKAVEFVKAAADAGMPLAVICHAPWILVETGLAKDLTCTSWPSLQTDLRNAGATWVDEVCVEDRGIVTSRKPDDIPKFNQKMIELFAQSRNKTSTAERGTIDSSSSTLVP